MARTSRARYVQCFLAALTAVALWAANTSTAAAQFGLPKIPKIPKKTTTQSTSETKPSKSNSPEVALVLTTSPNSAPPGGHGELVLTGQNFKDGMQVQFACQGAQFKAESVKVESPTRAVVQIKVPFTAQEGPCEFTPSSGPSGKQTFQISNSADMPVAIPASLLGEGDMQFMELMMKMQQALAPGFGNQGEAGRIELSGGSIKYMQGDKATFSESTSAVKDLGEMKQGGQSMGIFRIAFKDGKIYNFFGGQQSTDAHAAFVYLQKKLGK